MDQSVEEVDRISWEADMMRAEEHFDAMDEEACAMDENEYRDEDYAEEDAEEDAE